MTQNGFTKTEQAILGRTDCCSICGYRYGKHGNDHRCGDRKIANLNIGRSSWGKGDAIPGRQVSRTFSGRLLETLALRFPDQKARNDNQRFYED